MTLFNEWVFDVWLQIKKEIKTISFWGHLLILFSALVAAFPCVQLLWDGKYWMKPEDINQCKAILRAQRETILKN